MSIPNLPRPAIPVRSIDLSHGYIGQLRPVTSLRIIGVYSVVVVLLWLMLISRVRLRPRSPRRWYAPLHYFPRS